MHEGRRTQGSQEPRVPRGHHPDRRARAGGPRPRGRGPEGRRRRARRSTTTEYVAAGATIVDTADDAWGTRRDMVLKVKEPVAEEYERMREGQVLFTYLHLAADKPLTEELVAAQGHRDRLRDGAAALGRAAAALPDVGGRRLPGAAGRRALAAQGPGRPRGADGWRRRRGQRQGRHHRRRRLRPERRQHRARHGRRRDAAGHRPRQAADVVLALQQPGARPGLVQARHRAAGDGGRHGDRGGADPGRGGAEAGQQRAGLADEAGLGARRHRRRPGRLLRGHPRHHARRPDVRGAQLDLLLRGEHARRGAEHLDVRPHQRDPAVRRGAGRQGLGAGLPGRPQPRARASTPTPGSSPTSRSARPSASIGRPDRCWP